MQNVTIQQRAFHTPLRRLTIHHSREKITSMNRLSYDTCAYSKALSESVAPLDYMLDKAKYEHCDRCRIELGLVGGTAVSHVAGNLVDLENNLFGIDRPSTKCPSFKYQPVAHPGAPLQGKEYIKPVQHPVIDTTPRHLRACQMHDYPEVPHPPAHQPFVCQAQPSRGPAPVGMMQAGADTMGSPW